MYSTCLHNKSHNQNFRDCLCCSCMQCCTVIHPCGRAWRRCRSEAQPRSSWLFSLALTELCILTCPEQEHLEQMISTDTRWHLNSPSWCLQQHSCGIPLTCKICLLLTLFPKMRFDLWISAVDHSFRSMMKLKMYQQLQESMWLSCWWSNDVNLTTYLQKLLLVLALFTLLCGALFGHNRNTCTLLTSSA